MFSIAITRPSSWYSQLMPRIFSRTERNLCLMGVLLGAAGCHSAVVDATVQNRSGGPLTLLEVDYPSASFGTQTLASGADFHYRFKVLGNGPLKMSYTDAARHDHTSNGPALQEGTEGLLSITIGPSGASSADADDVHWQTTFRQTR